MRILWVKLGGLLPLTAGGRIRSFHMIRELSERHSISVLTTHATDADASDLQQMLPRCEQVRSFPHAPAKRDSARFAADVGRAWLSPLPFDLWRWRVPTLRAATTSALASEGFDVCVADFLAAMPNLPKPAPLPVILFEHNVEHVIWRRLSHQAAAWQRPLLALEWRKLRRYERRACLAARLTITVSEPDRALLESLAPGRPVTAIPTGVDAEYYVANGRAEAALSLAFVGSMDWYPNEDAALYLIDAILPLIRNELPDARLTIVGRNPSLRLRSAASRAGVLVTGTVADVRPYVAETSVLVVPIRIGGGTRLKIFEGLAMEKAIVSTTVGAEGLPLVSGEHFVAADEPSAFAREVVSLLRDPVRRRALGVAGRRFVLDRHSWAHAARSFEACLEAVALSR